MNSQSIHPVSAIMSLLFLILPALLIALLTNTKIASAADTSKFNAENIIADRVFTDYKSMSASQIQSFLNSKNSVCLKNFQTLGLYDDDKDGLGDEPYGKGQNKKVSAATLIWQAAQLYRINPQVILATLQKEQGLITRSDCPQWRYNTALGYGCPDHEPCDTSAYGFTRQIDYGVWHFRGFFDDTYPIPPTVPGNKFIAYNPNSSCGGKTINIRNRATAALYSYTPYQPNAATLAAAPGQTVHCGAYGNLNFWRYFTDWFGSTQDSIPTFSFERLDGLAPAVKPSSGTSLGEFTSTVSIKDKLHSFYYDATNKALRHAWWDGSKWNTEILDGQGSNKPGSTTDDVGMHVATHYNTGNNEVRVFYYNETKGDIRYARMSGSSGNWAINTLDGAGGNNGRISSNVGRGISATNYRDSTQLFYYDASNGNLRHAWDSTGNWKFENLDGSTNSVGKFSADIGQTSTVTLYNGRLQLFYYDASNGNLRHAWWNNNRWNFETFDGSAISIGKLNANVGQFLDAVQYNKSLQLFYYDASNGNLRHAWSDKGKWKFETFDGSAGSVIKNNVNAGKNTVIKVLKGELYVFYQNTGANSWLLSHWNGHSWYGYALDGTSTSLSSSSLPVGGELSASVYKESSMQIFYRDSIGGLRHTWGRSNR